MDKKVNNIIAENARIGFRNFSGKAGKYNPEGNRNFCWFIDDYNLAKTLEEDGWAIKYANPRDPDDDPQAYMQVRVRFDNIPPKIILITSNGKTALDEEDINILDWAEIDSVDMIIRPYIWNVSGKTGIKGYIKSMYVKIAEDEFDLKYKDVPDSAKSAITINDNPYPDDAPF